MTRACEEFLADREANAAHLESCESCREIVRQIESLERGIASAKIDASADLKGLDDLPVAPWEGASARSWIAVTVVAFVIAALGLGGFVLLGIDPVRGFVGAMTGAMSTEDLLTLAKSAPGFLATAPMRFHVMLFAAFVIVNVIFVVLLRKRLRGYDA